MSCRKTGSAAAAAAFLVGRTEERNKSSNGWNVNGGQVEDAD